MRSTADFVLNALRQMNTVERKSDSMLSMVPKRNPEYRCSSHCNRSLAPSWQRITWPVIASQWTASLRGIASMPPVVTINDLIVGGTRYLCTVPIMPGEHLVTDARDMAYK